MRRTSKAELRKIQRRLRDNELELEGCNLRGAENPAKFLRRLIQQDRSIIARIERELAGRGR